MTAVETLTERADLAVELGRSVGRRLVGGRGGELSARRGFVDLAVAAELAALLEVTIAALRLACAFGGLHGLPSGRNSLRGRRREGHGGPFSGDARELSLIILAGV